MTDALVNDQERIHKKILTEFSLRGAGIVHPDTSPLWLHVGFIVVLALNICATVPTKCLFPFYKRQQISSLLTILFNSIQFNSIRFNSIQFNSIQFNSIRFDSIRFNSIQFNSIRFDSIQFNSIQFNSIRFDSIQFNSIQFNSIQFNSIQFNSIPINSIQFNSIQFNSIQMPTYAPTYKLSRWRARQTK